MKKIICALLCAVCMFSSAAPVMAKNQSVNDYAGLLDEVEIDYLETLVQAVVEHTGLDIVILTADSTSGKSSMDYADDFYDENGYGIGKDYSGILLLINLDKREMWISTSGTAVDYFTDDRISSMLDDLYDDLSQERYAGACERFIELVRQDYDLGIPGNQYTVEELTMENRIARSLRRLPIYILAGGAIGLIVVLIMIAANKGKNTVDSRTYAVRNGFELTGKNDRFITMVHTHRRINTNSGGGGHGSSGGRSTTHMGSSGRSHGGGGRKF